MATWAYTSYSQKCIFYTKRIYLQLVLITIYPKLGLLPKILQNTEIRSVWPFLRLYGLKCVPSSGAPSVPEINIFPRQGEQRPVIEFSYMGYSPPKCSFKGTPNIQFTFHTIHVNILGMHILTKPTHVIYS